MQNLKRWHWMLIAVVLGLVVGYIRTLYLDMVLDGHQTISSQERFEQVLTTKEKLPGGERFAFTNLVVVRDPEDKEGKTYAVMGRCISGRPFLAPDGKIKRYDLPYLYMAKTPYVPKKPVPADAVKKSSRTFNEFLQSVCEAIGLKKRDDPNSVLTYLRQLRAAYGIQFTYQWWKEPRVTVAMTVLGSVIVIGGIWPTIVNLIVFGSIFRPREEKGISLRKVRRPAEPAPQKPREEMTDEELKQLLEMEARLEAELAAEMEKRRQEAPAAAAQPKHDQPARKFTAQPTEPAPVVEQPKEEKVFERRPDDYYPIHRGKPKKSDEE